jgi:hypothetical protein
MEKDIDEIDKQDAIDLLPCAPTEAIIAELEKRRPCERCEFKGSKWTLGPCDECLWGELRKDNFKEAK